MSNDQVKIRKDHKSVNATNHEAETSLIDGRRSQQSKKISLPRNHIYRAENTNNNSNRDSGISGSSNESISQIPSPVEEEMEVKEDSLSNGPYNPMYSRSNGVGIQEGLKVTQQSNLKDDDEEEEDDGDSENSSLDSENGDKGGVSSSPKATQASRRKKLYRKSRKKSQTNSPLGTPKLEQRVPPITTGSESEEEETQNGGSSPQRRPSRPTRKKGSKNKPKSMSPAQNTMVASTSELFGDMGLETDRKQTYFDKLNNGTTSPSSTSGLVSYLRVNDKDDIILCESEKYTKSNAKFRRVASAVIRSFKHYIKAHDNIRPICALELTSTLTDTASTCSKLRTQSSPPKISQYDYSLSVSSPPLVVDTQAAHETQIISSKHNETETNEDCAQSMLHIVSPSDEKQHCFQNKSFDKCFQSDDLFMKKKYSVYSKIIPEKKFKSISTSLPKVNLRFEENVTHKDVGSSGPQLIALQNGSISVGACLRRSSLHGTPQRYIDSHSRRCSLLATPIRNRNSFSLNRIGTRPFTTDLPIKNKGKWTRDLCRKPLETTSNFQSEKDNRPISDLNHNISRRNSAASTCTVASRICASTNDIRRTISSKSYTSPSPTRKQNTNISKLLCLKGRISQQINSKDVKVPKSESSITNDQIDNIASLKQEQNGDNVLGDSSATSKTSNNLRSPKKVATANVISRKKLQNQDKITKRENSTNGKVIPIDSASKDSLETKRNQKKGMASDRTQNVKGNTGKNSSTSKPKNTVITKASQNDKNNVRKVINKAKETMNSGSTKVINKQNRTSSPPKPNTRKSDTSKNEEGNLKQETEQNSDTTKESAGNMEFTKDYYIKAFGQFDDLQPIDDDLKDKVVNNKDIDELQDSSNPTLTLTSDISNSAFEDEVVCNEHMKPSPLKTGSASPSRMGRRKSSLKDLMGDSDALERFQKSKFANRRKSKSVGGMLDADILEQEENDDLEELPDFAKSYILTKKKTQKTRQRLKTVSEYGHEGEDPNEVYNNPNVPEAFKFEMLKAALDYDGGISSGDKLDMLGPARRGTRTSLGNVVTNIDPSGFDGFESGRTTRTGISRMSNKHSSWNEGKRAKGKKKRSKDAPGAERIPCTGPGTLAEYGEYLKAGGFVPLPVMDAEEGVKKGVFAANKSTNGYSGYDTPSSEFGITNQGNAAATLDFAELSIQRQFDAINEKYKLPEDDDVLTAQEKGAVNALKSLGMVPDKGDDKVDLLSGKGDSLLDNAKPKEKKKPKRESLAKRSMSKAKPKNPKRKQATDDLLLFGDEDEDDAKEPYIPPNNSNGSAADSGYSSARKSSFGAPVSSGSTLPPIIGDDSERGSDDDVDSIMEMAEADPDLKAYKDELKEQRLLDEALKGQNLLGMMIEDKPKFGQQPTVANSKVEGVDAIDLFLDPMSVFGSERHPALQEVLKEIEKQKESRGEELAKLKQLAKELKRQRGEVGRLRAEKLRLQEQLFRMRSTRKESHLRRQKLLTQAKQLQARAAKYKEKQIQQWQEEMEKLSVIWEERLKEEQTKTAPLEEVCAALREDLDAQHKKRMESFETKMKPIIIKEGPSKKANYKIAAAKLHYEIYALTQRLRLTTIRVEYEEAKRAKRERQVRTLRDEISDKKTLITTVTKGIPFNKIEVRPQGQLPKHSGPQGGMEQNPLLSNTATAAILAAGLNPHQLVANPFGLPAAASPMPGGWPANSLPGISSGSTPLPGLGGGANDPFSSARNPPAYTNGPPPQISAEAAAAAAASMAKEEEEDEMAALTKD